MSEPRVSVLDCGSPLPLCVGRPAVEKRQRAAAVQNLAELFKRAGKTIVVGNSQICFHKIMTAKTTGKT
jgi:hypothetical protein